MLRFFEKLLALLLFLLLSPLFLFVSLVILLSAGRPVLFKQKRIGRGGKNFLLFKFRTMHKNAQREKIAWKRNNPELWQEYCDNNFKLENDRRIIRFGCVIRKASLDELPQLFNIIKGDMSFIGPRPLLLRERKEYGKNIKYYKKMTPGISGLWQVSGRSRTSFAERVESDMEFYKKRNVRMYIYILIKTIFVIFHINKTH